MKPEAITKIIDLGDGRSISIETGKLAKQAHGSAVVRSGNTMLLATIVSNKEAKEGLDYFPLTVEYREKFASAGKIPGGFFKREARPSDYETLVSRLVDRALRPLFPDDYHGDTQMLITLISADKDSTPDALACLAASSALAVSDIPFHGPVSEVRVARINGKMTINPTYEELKNSDIDLIVAATEKNIVMVEGEMKEVQEADMITAIKFAHEHIKMQCKAQIDLAASVEKSKVKRVYCHEVNDELLHEALKLATADKIRDVAKSHISNKDLRNESFKKIKEDYINDLPEEEREEKTPLINRYFHEIEKDEVRKMVISDRVRLDGRKLDEIRPIWSEVDYLPGAHGSAIFTRGETQSLTTVTLGTKLDEQTIDGAVVSGTLTFMLHYNFPPFSTGEVKMLRGTSRREVGHGNLAFRAIKPIIPDTDVNPYTIRIVSDILESNGSSSMATVCAGSLALMDAGVKTAKHVSGIAMGLITSDDGKYAVLSDILGDEDHLGDMDFKVCGTREGITACQMDIKTEGLTFAILEEALEQARKGRIHILGKLYETISTPNADYKPHAPRIVQLIIDKDYIGAVIGPGGKVIKEIQSTTGAVISIEEVDGKGIVQISSDNKEALEAAVARVKGIATSPEVGEVYRGRVTSLKPFGAFVEILPGKEGLLHVSEIDWHRIENVETVFREGDEVEVKLLEIEAKTGKLRLSRKALIPRPERQPAERVRN